MHHHHSPAKSAAHGLAASTALPTVSFLQVIYGTKVHRMEKWVTEQAGFPRQLVFLIAIPSISQKGGMVETLIQTVYCGGDR